MSNDFFSLDDYDQDQRAAEQGDAKDALHQSEIAIANFISYQSAGKSPTIHEYGQARRALEAVRAAILASKGEPT